MDGDVFNLGLLAAGLAFLGIIALSAIGGLLERSIKSEAEKKKFGKISVVLAFSLFVILCFSLVPVFVGVFVSLLKGAVPADIGFIEKNDMLIVFGFWAIIVIGLAIALPFMKKDDFFSETGKQGAGRRHD
jgi:ABC-type sulfate transport system permease subunit